MIWTEPQSPKEGVSNYDHVISETPIGKFIIEWKSWKDSPDYGIELDGIYIGTEYSLDDAKKKCGDYLTSKHKALSDFLNS